jgi:DNA-binding response OmpR family regulator
MTETLDVLIVDDTEGCRDLYQFWLEADHDVRTAPNGTVALDEIDPDVDLVVVDRNMPGPSGLDVAAEIRTNGYDCQIIMSSSERIDFELADSPIDEYVKKPTDRETLEAAVEQVATQHAYQSALFEFFAVSATVGRVEANLPREQLETIEEYLTLRDQVKHKHTQVNTILEQSSINWEAAFESFSSSEGSTQRSPTASSVSFAEPELGAR